MTELARPAARCYPGWGSRFELHADPERLGECIRCGDLLPSGEPLSTLDAPCVCPWPDSHPLAHRTGGATG